MKKKQNKLVNFIARKKFSLEAKRLLVARSQVWGNYIVSSFDDTTKETLKLYRSVLAAYDFSTFETYYKVMTEKRRLLVHELGFLR